MSKCAAHIFWFILLLVFIQISVNIFHVYTRINHFQAIGFPHTHTYTQSLNKHLLAVEVCCKQIKKWNIYTCTLALWNLNNIFKCLFMEIGELNNKYIQFFTVCMWIPTRKTMPFSELSNNSIDGKQFCGMFRSKKKSELSNFYCINKQANEYFYNWKAQNIFFSLCTSC